MVFFWLFIITVLVSAVLYLYNLSRFKEQRRQIIMLSQNNSLLKSELSKCTATPKDITIEFHAEENSHLTLRENTPLCLAPFQEGIKLKVIKGGTTVELLFSAKVKFSGNLEELWYEIVEASGSNINSHGWIKAQQISKSY
jgi:hypothetical protein